MFLVCHFGFMEFFHSFLTITTKMGCSSSSTRPIPVSLGFQNKRGGPQDKDREDVNTEEDDMTALTVPDYNKSISTSTQRKKVALKPGRSMIDWMKFHRNHPDPSGTGGKMIKVTKEELEKHNKVDDAWMALFGKVYNVTHYMEYHPGGIPELLRGCGKDATSLFTEIHSWVNYESMLKRCCVGVLEANVFDLSQITAPSTESLTYLEKSAGHKLKPRYSWFQKDNTVKITIMNLHDDIQRHHIIVDKNGLNVVIHLIVGNCIFVIDLNFEGDVHPNYEIVKSPTERGEMDVVFKKVNPSIFWSILGTPNPDDGQWKTFSVSGLTYRECRLDQRDKLTHDTHLFRFRLPRDSFCIFPVGCHVFIRAFIKGFPCEKPYTVVPPFLHGGSAVEDDDYYDDGHSVCFIIKVYPYGVLTPELDKLKEGSMVEISRAYTGTAFEDKLGLACGADRLYLIAAGTGITPMISLLNHLAREGNISSNKNKKRSVQIFFFNKSEEDIIWLEEFRRFSKEHSWLTFVPVLSNPSDKWKGLKGRVSKDMLKNITRGSKQNCFFCVCGPTPFTQLTCRLLRELSVSDTHVHAFTE